VSDLPILLAPEERVLSTLNADGSRRWIRPRPSPGKFQRARQGVAYGLMFVFFVIPYLRIFGRPVILLDLPARQFTLLGTTFLPTDTLLFMLLALTLAFTIFFVTAMFGRVWCGWGCPQTVYMEFLFRPIERWLEGGAHGSAGMDRQKGLPLRRAIKLGIYAVLALFLAHTFLAYFVPVAVLAQWMHRSPVQHPISFFVAIGTTAAIWFDFAYFREQTCLVACPYGRLQSVLLDRKSLIVGYDAMRGEPRRKGIKDRPSTAGDCIDCRMCVLTCPTGIDIREGLQMECIHCTQCADACDAVMTKIGKRVGLVRYGSRDAFAGLKSGWLRTRVLLYPVAIVAALAVFTWQLAVRGATDVTLVRASGVPFTLEPDGSVMNQVRVRITNRGEHAQRFAVALENTGPARLLSPSAPIDVPPGEARSAIALVLTPRAAFTDGLDSVTFRVSDAQGHARAVAWRLMGPEDALPAASGVQR
jgi:cytochrome c oxidase accessory protein FixG